VRDAVIDLIDDPWIDPQGIRQYARAGGYDLLVIDHLHQLAWTERRDLENAVRFIANIARELELPILLLAQLKRPGDSYPRPTMSAFRDTGMIEALAAACWLIHRPRDLEGKRGAVAEFVVAKNRYGPEGVHTLSFQGDYVRFTEPPNLPSNPPVLASKEAAA
jgi:replicative DNA helicase